MTSLHHPPIPFPRSRRSQRVFVPLAPILTAHLEGRAAYLNQAATEKFQQGDLRGARELFTKAVNIQPGSPAVAFNLALLLQNENRLEEAAHWYARSIALFNDNAQAHFNLGFCYRSLGRRTRSEAAFRAGLKVDPRRVDIWLVVGITCTERGDHHAAARAFSRGLAIDANDANLHAYRGTALKEIGDLRDGIAELRRALELDPGHQYARMNLALAARQHQEGALRSLGMPVLVCDARSAGPDSPA